jgi:hypothetical protein
MRSRHCRSGSVDADEIRARRHDQEDAHAFRRGEERRRQERGREREAKNGDNDRSTIVLSGGRHFGAQAYSTERFALTARRNPK